MRLVVLFGAALAVSAAEIPQGSHCLLRVVNSVTTRTASPGDYVYLRTAMPIFANGQVVVPEGSYVQAVVTQSTRSGRVKGRAELAIRIETMTLPSGQVVRVSPQVSSVDSEGSEQKADKEGHVKQGGSKEADLARTAKISGAGAAIGGMADHSWSGAGIGAGIGGGVGLASVLVTRGKEVELRQGSTIDVTFDRAIPIE